MRRAVAVAATSAALLLAGAAPALAQYPGTNGTITFFDSSQEVWSGASPLNDPINDCEGFAPPECMGPHSVDVIGDGGATWSPDGSTLYLNGVQYSADNDDAVPAHGQATADDESDPGSLVRISSTGVLTDIAALDGGTGISTSPDGKKIAVTQDGDINVLNSTTGNLTLHLTPNLPNTVESDPSWSPKNSGIAYTASDGIRIRPVAGGAAKLWMKGVHQPHYSPDGSKIAFLTSKDVLEYADASTGKNIVNTRMVVEAPYGGEWGLAMGTFEWSPDGKQFLFDGINGCAIATTAGKVTSHPVDKYGVAGDCDDIAWARK